MRISAFNRSCERKQSHIYPSRSLKKVPISFDHDPILFSTANPTDEVFGRHRYFGRSSWGPSTNSTGLSLKRLSGSGRCSSPNSRSSSSPPSATISSGPSCDDCLVLIPLFTRLPRHYGTRRSACSPDLYTQTQPWRGICHQPTSFRRHQSCRRIISGITVFSSLANCWRMPTGWSPYQASSCRADMTFLSTLHSLCPFSGLAQSPTVFR